MFRFIIYINLLFLLLITGCKCKNKTTLCIGINPKYAKLIRYRTNDSIVYSNNNAESISFMVKTYNSINNNYLKDCKDSMFGCICEPCTTNASFSATSLDSAWVWVDSVGNQNNYHKMGYMVTDNVNNATLNFDIAHLYYKLLFPYKNLDMNQKLIPNITLGSKNYTDVILIQIDTSNFSTGIYRTQNHFMTKLYFQAEYGIIGFHDIKSNSLFYLE